ncbi:MAG: TonB-dependent receptor [Vicinamibacteraceae bacterium]|nr:TonB-dependent receptor [Vicinamibacteraceae bacterium]
MRQWLRLFVVGAACLTSAGTAAAQDTLGSLEGRVRDASGGALPGVTVTLSGPAMMGTRATTSEADGGYRFVLVPPGSEYTVRAELQGFSTLVRPHLEVRAGQTVTVDLEMQVGALAESLEVRAPSPVIDLRSTVRSFTVDSEAVSYIPLTTSQRYADLFTLVPGVNDQLDAPGIGTNMIINGASATQNKVYVDGIDATDHVNASLVTELNNAVIDEVSISTSGFEAGSGFGTGGSMSIVTRSGGNQFHGGASMFLTPKRFNDSNREGVAPADVETYFPEGHLGGPIKRDRMWFFVSDKYLYQNTGFVNITDFRKEVRGHQAYAKVTHQLSPEHRLAYIYQWDRRESKNDFATVIFTEDATSIAKFGGYMVGVNWDYQLGGNRFLHVVGSYFDKPGTTNGRNGDSPRRIYQDVRGSVLRFEDNYDRDLTNEATRWYFSGRYSHALTFFGSHDLQLSAELYPERVRLTRQRLNVLETYRDSAVYGPRQLFMVQTPRPLEGTDNKGIDRGYGLAIQDSWRPTSRLTVNAGLRYEYNKTTLEGVDALFTDFGSWSPRVGAAYALDDKTVIKSSFSRIGQKFALDFLFTFYPNAIVYDTAQSSQVNGVLDIFTQGTSTATTTRNIDRKVPYALEYTVSLQRQLPWRIAAEVGFIQRRFKGFTDSIDRNLILDIPNKRFVGRIDPRFDALTDVVTSDRQQTVYRALQVWVNRRLANRWQLDASYTYQLNRQDGEFGYGTTANAAQQFAYGDRADEFFETRVGPKHMLKLAGSYSFPWDITAGLYYSKKSATVRLDTYNPAGIGAIAPRVTLSNGRVVADPLFNPELYVAPPDEEVGRDIGGAHLFNLQIEKVFRIGSQRFRIVGLAYNLPNSARVLNYTSSNVDNANYTRISSVQPPRAGQIAFGWEF